MHRIPIDTEQLEEQERMKAVILAGGRGTRISEESQARPKPMVEIGGRPVLWQSRLHDQGILRELLLAHVRCHH